MNERKKYDLTGKNEEYPGIFRWNGSWYILVKDGEHYPIAKKKMDIMVREARNKPNEIVLHYKPRVRREKDPNAVVKKSKAQIYIESQSGARNLGNKRDPRATAPSTWIHPDYQNPDDGMEYVDGFLVGPKK